MRDQVTGGFPGVPPRRPGDPAGHRPRRPVRRAICWRASTASVLVCYGDTAAHARRATYRVPHRHSTCGRATPAPCSPPRPGRGAATTAASSGKADGSFSQVVEDKDCTPEQKAVAGAERGRLRVPGAGAAGRPGPAQPPTTPRGSCYITDAPALHPGQPGAGWGVCDTCSAQEMLGVNTVEQLAEVERACPRQGRPLTGPH